MARKKSTYKKKTKVIKYRHTKNKSFNGQLRIKRYCNMVDTNGVDISSSTGITLDVVTSKCIIFTSDATAGNPSYGTLTYHARLDDLPNYDEFTKLYDQYKIDKIKIKLMPYCNSVGTGGAVSNTQGQSGIFVHSIIDYDDAQVSSTPASELGIDQMRQHNTYKFTNILNKPLSRTFVPRVNTAVSNNTNTLAQKSESFGWMDANSPDVAGYGFKCIFENISAGSALQLYVKPTVTYFMSFRHPR